MKQNLYSSGRYLEQNPGWHSEDSAWKAGHIAKILERVGVHPTSVCDVGCGAGEVLNQLSRHLPGEVRFEGYEVSPQAFELCQKIGHPRIRFQLKNLSDDTEAHFDLVMAIDVFEHVEDYFGFLRKMKDRGEFKLFHIPLDLSVQTVLRSKPILRGRQGVGHLHYFTRETALATLRDSGYEILDAFYTASANELQSKSLLSTLARLPRKVFFSLHQHLAVRILGGYSLMVLAK